MNGSSITLRSAKPTREEGIVFARFLNEAAEGFFQLLLGRRFLELIAESFVQPCHDFSYEYVTFAEIDEQIVGMASGYTKAQHDSAKDEILKLAGGSKLRMMAVAMVCGPLLQFLDTLAEGDFYLQAIAIDKAHRGKGIGTTLIQRIESQASSSGATQLCLDVSIGNEGARRLYERYGMKMESKSPKVWFFPRLRVARMVKSIELRN